MVALGRLPSVLLARSGPAELGRANEGPHDAGARSMCAASNSPRATAPIERGVPRHRLTLARTGTAPAQRWRQFMVRRLSERTAERDQGEIRRASVLAHSRIARLLPERAAGAAPTLVGPRRAARRGVVGCGFLGSSPALIRHSSRCCERGTNSAAAVPREHRRVVRGANPGLRRRCARRPLRQLSRPTKAPGCLCNKPDPTEALRPPPPFGALRAIGLRQFQAPGPQHIPLLRAVKSSSVGTNRL